ncbi:MAG: hypothetical protein P8R54_17870 [Myxococcota bacterium]|nr:hypothetical protein [Myxococcota bacterium]
MNGEAQGPSGQQFAMQVALEAVASWRRGVEDDAARRQLELDADEARLTADKEALQRELEMLQRELENVARVREETARELSVLPAYAEQRIHEAILASLKTDGTIISERAVLYSAAAAARDEKVSALATADGIAQKLEAFEQLETNREEALASVPALYRSALIAQHEENRRELAPLFEALSAEIEPLDVEPSGITLVASVDPVTGPPEALAVILPISFVAYQRWADREEDLETWIGYRVVAAVSGALSTISASDAPVQFAPYKNGQLAIQVWLADSEAKGDLRASFDAEIASLAACAGEFRTAGLSLGVTWQPPEVIAPATDEQED